MLRLRTLTLRVQSIFTSLSYCGFKKIYKLPNEQALQLCALINLGKANWLVGLEPALKPELKAKIDVALPAAPNKSDLQAHILSPGFFHVFKGRMDAAVGVDLPIAEQQHLDRGCQHGAGHRLDHPGSGLLGLSPCWPSPATSPSRPVSPSARSSSRPAGTRSSRRAASSASRDSPLRRSSRAGSAAGSRRSPS